jgi:hypothetical protein
MLLISLVGPRKILSEFVSCTIVNTRANVDLSHITDAEYAERTCLYIFVGYKAENLFSLVEMLG